MDVFDIKKYNNSKSYSNYSLDNFKYANVDRVIYPQTLPFPFGYESRL